MLATYACDSLGRGTGVTRGDGTTTAYGYDAADHRRQSAVNGSGAD